jgi:hypothetical protein
MGLPTAQPFDLADSPKELHHFEIPIYFSSHQGLVLKVIL